MMRRNTIFIFVLMVLSGLSARPAITVYNDHFGVVREPVTLQLDTGSNEVSYTGVTAELEPESVVLRDPTGQVAFSVIEQSYRGEPLDEPRLLELFEGQTISFLKKVGEAEVVVDGRIIRAPRRLLSASSGQKTYYSRGYLDPIIEVEGALMTKLPGSPRFPSLGDDSVLLPTLEWKLFAEEAVELEAQLSYITGGLSWKADYNLILPEEGDDLVLTGWVSIQNKTGKTFEETKIKLVAGDVNRVQPDEVRGQVKALLMEARQTAPQVESEKFDEFHVYRLPLPTTLHHGETKQVEFIRSAGVQTERHYVYDGAHLPYAWEGQGRANQNQSYGVDSHSDVAIYREFENTEANGMGLALPGGHLRFYRADKDGQLEFTGENKIDHTAKDETIRVYLGNAFDLVGERKQTSFFKHPSRDLIRESFEVEVRNRSEEPVRIHVVEHLYRWANWKIETGLSYTKKDARTIEFPVDLAPGDTATIPYTVEYHW
ncbi:MAG: DUF4139 domain-containing protein [Coraliomargaritaceae bacterium]